MHLYRPMRILGKTDRAIVFICALTIIAGSLVIGEVLYILSHSVPLGEIIFISINLLPAVQVYIAYRVLLCGYQTICTCLLFAQSAVVPLYYIYRFIAAKEPVTIIMTLDAMLLWLPIGILFKRYIEWINFAAFTGDEELGKKYECVVCMYDISFDEASITSCKHIYHKKCIEEWLLYRTVCPICLTTLDDS